MSIQLSKYIFLFFTFLLAGCSSVTQLSVAEDGWKFEKSAVTIEIQTPADLNARSGRPHALMLGIFQLSDPNTFGALTQEASGAIQLLREGRIDDTVVDFRRVTVQPGERLTRVLSRADSAKYIGVISGYFDLNVKQDVKLFKIPCTASGRGIVEKVLASMALIADEAKAHPAKINININLGRSGVKKYKTADKESLSSYCT